MLMTTIVSPPPNKNDILKCIQRMLFHKSVFLVSLRRKEVLLTSLKLWDDAVFPDSVTMTSIKDTIISFQNMPVAFTVY